MIDDKLNIILLEYAHGQLMQDLIFALAHPMECCKVCKFRDADCSRSGQNCKPEWRGTHEE